MNSAIYFVTICTYRKVKYFGEIKENYMGLSQVGGIVKDEWLRTPTVRSKMNIKLGEYIIMPDHFHGILSIGTNQFNKRNRRDALNASHELNASRDENKSYRNKFGPQSNNLASIVRGFKSAVSSKARKIVPEFRWQRLFYDRIIRDQLEYDFVRYYIIENPQNWKPG